jgi:hypothetical protein
VFLEDCYPAPFCRRGQRRIAAGRTSPNHDYIEITHGFLLFFKKHHIDTNGLIIRIEKSPRKNVLVPLEAKFAHFEEFFHRDPLLLEVNGLDRIWLDVKGYELC